MDIGRPKRVIEVEPATLPIPEVLPVPQPAPESLPESVPVEPAP